MANLKRSQQGQGLEFSKILSLRRANQLTEENLNKYLGSDEAKEVARTLMNEADPKKELNVSQRGLYKAIDKLT